ncbi:MAG: hypothetical protein IJ225_09795 [Solobacterium sp.]|nr:hypothetical protein [Solobacterium sp.]
MKTKHIWRLLAVAVLMTSCGTSTATEPEPAEVAEPVIELRPSDEYESLEVAYLGATSDTRSVNDIIERTASWEDFPDLTALSEEDIIYGSTDETYNNVYLLIPAKDTALTIGAYNWYAGELTTVYYEANLSSAVIYVEDSDSPTPRSIIRYARTYDGSLIEDEFFTGSSLIERSLRTDYHMGIVDITPYDNLDSSEFPFYGQAVLDLLTMDPVVQEVLVQGGTLAPMGEELIEGNMYGVYDLELPDGTHWLCAATPAYDADPKVLVTKEPGNWWPEED